MEGEGGSVMEAFYVPSSLLGVCSHGYHCKINFFALNCQQEHGSGTSTWFLATAQTMKFHMVSGVRMCHRPQHGLWWQYTPQTSIHPSATAGATDTSLALGGVAAQAKDINMAYRATRATDTNMMPSGDPCHNINMT